jgi:2-keto-4-pentenoate hydratase
VTPSGQAQAADLIWALWRDGNVIGSLPAGLRPATRGEGYAIQALQEARSAWPLFGWKIAATSRAGQQHIGVSGPIAGRLLAERVHEDGATLKVGANRMRVAEPEFAFRFARDLAPRAEPYSVDEVMAAVGHLHPAIEVPDSRFEDFARVGEAQLIADNACAHEFVLGVAAPESWRTTDLARHMVRGEIVDKLERPGCGANVLDDPRLALTWLVNEVTRLGVTLKARQVVTTGTCMPPLEIEAGDRVRMDFGRFGTVTATFAD